MWGTSQCLEALGGNGYIEDWPLARILRDAQVLPIRDGTSTPQPAPRRRARAGPGRARSVERELAYLSVALTAAAALPEAPRSMRALADRLCWLYGILALAGGTEDEPELARLLLAAGPGIDEGTGPGDAVPAGFETELVSGL